MCFYWKVWMAFQTWYIWNYIHELFSTPAPPKMFLLPFSFPPLSKCHLYSSSCLGLNLGFIFLQLCLCALHGIQQKLYRLCLQTCPDSNSFKSLQQITRGNQSIKGKRIFNLWFWKFKNTVPASAQLWWQGILCHIVVGVYVRIHLWVRKHRETENLGPHNSFRCSIKSHILKVYIIPQCHHPGDQVFT